MSTPDVRQRLLDGLATGIRAKGYQATTIADIVREASTSRRTFYEHFVDRDDCFLALLHDLNARHVALVADAVDPAAAWSDQVRQAIGAWLAGVRSEPEIALSWIRDAPRLGAPHQAQQQAHQQAFVDLIDGLIRAAADDPGAPHPLSRARSIILVGGLRELVAATVESGRDVGELTEEAIAATTALLTAPAEVPA